MTTGAGRMVFTSIFLSISTLCGVGGARAQTAQGRITDDSGGRPLVGAEVSLVNDEDKIVATALSDADGEYRITAPRPGDYKVQVDLLGFRKLLSPLVSLTTGGLLNADFELPPDPVELEGLRVEADRLQEIRRTVQSYGVRVDALGERFVDRAAIEKRITSGDFGRVLQWQSVPNMRVRRSDDAAIPDGSPIVCVQLVPGSSRCAIVALNGVLVSRQTAALIPPESLEAMVVLKPAEAVLVYGTDGGGGAVLLFTRTSR